MHCPRCQTNVMPGLPECPACGQSMEKPPAPERTVPQLGPSRDLLGQRADARRHALRAYFRRPVLTSLRVPSLNAARGRFTWPPLVEALEGMFFGRYYFINGQRDFGIAVAVADALLIFLTLAQAVWSFNIPSFGGLILTVLMISGGGAAYQVCARNDYPIYPRIFMGAATPMMIVTFVIIVGNFGIRPFGYQIMTMRQAVTVGSESLFPASMILESIEPTGENVKRGDILFRGPYGATQLSALPGDSIEIVGCKGLVNGEDRTLSLVPVYNGPELCGSLLPRTIVESGGMPVLIRNYDRANRSNNVRLGYLPWQDFTRPRLIFWPPAQWRTF